jgi:hypothetical protein
VASRTVSKNIIQQKQHFKVCMASASASASRLDGLITTIPNVVIFGLLSLHVSPYVLIH